MRLGTLPLPVVSDGIRYVLLLRPDRVVLPIGCVGP
jgi:hypothetical protein